MKIAYLIAAHSDPRQLRRLIDALDMGEDTWFFVHVDKKVRLQPFKHALNDLPIERVVLIKERIYTQWGGYSQCRYQQALMKNCLESGIIFDRIFFLSGLDYPIRSNEEILAYLEENAGRELIMGIDFTTCKEPAWAQEKVTRYHFFRDIHVSNVKVRKVFTETAFRLTGLLPWRKPNYIEREGEKLHLYKGSSWWCLSLDCLRYVYREMTQNPIYEHYFRYSLTPDEIMIQTIVFNSPFAAKAMLYEGPYPGLPALTPLHYIEYVHYIETFTEKDFEKLVRSGKLFARKICSGTSDKLVEQLAIRRTCSNFATK